MKKQLFIISFLFFYYSLIGQNGSSRLSIYFISDKHNLNNQYKSLIDKHLDSVKTFNFTSVKIIGHTDSIGNFDYNFNLSLKRAYSVLNYLIEKGLNRDSIKVEYLGENSPDFDNNTEGGKQKNRRTDIVFYRVEKSEFNIINFEKKIPKQREPREPNTIANLPTIVKQDTCDRDTILILPQGVEVRMGICDYYKKKDYFDVEPIINFDSLKNSDLMTYDTYGNPLVTGGMLLFKNHPVDTCFDKPIVIRYKLDSCDANLNFRLWDITPNGNWIEDKKTNVRRIKVGKDIYLEIQLKCIKNGRAKNFDVNICSKKIGFQIEKGLKITALRFVTRCNKFAASKKGIRSKSVTFWAPCTLAALHDQFVKVKAINNKGEIFEMDFKTISSLERKNRLSFISYCFGFIRLGKKCNPKESKVKFLFGASKMNTYLLPERLFKKLI